MMMIIIIMMIMMIWFPTWRRVTRPETKKMVEMM